LEDLLLLFEIEHQLERVDRKLTGNIQKEGNYIWVKLGHGSLLLFNVKYDQAPEVIIPCCNKLVHSDRIPFFYVPCPPCGVVHEPGNSMLFPLILLLFILFIWFIWIYFDNGGMDNEISLYSYVFFISIAYSLGTCKKTPTLISFLDRWMFQRPTFFHLQPAVANYLLPFERASLRRGLDRLSTPTAVLTPPHPSPILVAHSVCSWFHYIQWEITNTNISIKTDAGIRTRQG
jgi:hypothetical protein